MILTDRHQITGVPRPAKQPGLETSIKGIQFLISVPGGSETSVECTNPGNETLGPVRGLNPVSPRPCG